MVPLLLLFHSCHSFLYCSLTFVRQGLTNVKQWNCRQQGHLQNKGSSIKIYRYIYQICWVRLVWWWFYNWIFLDTHSATTVLSIGENKFKIFERHFTCFDMDNSIDIRELKNSLRGLVDLESTRPKYVSWLTRSGKITMMLLSSRSSLIHFPSWWQLVIAEMESCRFGVEQGDIKS